MSRHAATGGRSLVTYQDMVHISNEIRAVLDTARQVNLAAQNASLASRRAGNARGFQAVANELKAFSQQLASAMDGMAGDILLLAQGVSADFRQSHQLRLFRKIGDQRNDCPQLAQACERVSGIQTEHRRVQNIQVTELLVRLGRSLRLCMNGRTLARSAQIEATAGGSFEAMLRKVARDMERTIEEIHVRLQRIGTNLQQGKRDK